MDFVSGSDAFLLPLLVASCAWRCLVGQAACRMQAGRPRRLALVLAALRPMGRCYFYLEVSVLRDWCHLPSQHEPWESHTEWQLCCCRCDSKYPENECFLVLHLRSHLLDGVN